MPEAITNNKRIFKNTIMLYIRMILVLAIQLYTVPIVLKQLGVSDYGLYQVVGGVVTMLTFLSTAMSSGSQRFLAFAIGKSDESLLRGTFRSTFTLYVILALICVVLFESLGLWFLNSKMAIPEGREYAANWIYQLSVISFIINLLVVPFTAAIIAHEKMTFYAYVGIFDVLVKLVVVFILQVSAFDKVIVYAFLICVSTLLTAAINIIYCTRHFFECRNIKFHYDKELDKSILSYSVFNAVGALALVGRQQGLNVVINLFFGTILNAAHSLAQQIYSVVNQLISSVYSASRPQITKLYSGQNVVEMWRLTFRTAKLAFFLMILFFIPLSIELDYLLNLWLREVPEYTIPITILMVGSLVIETFTNQLYGVFQAYNRIKKCQLTASVILLGTVPLAYLYLKFISSNILLPYIISMSLSLLSGICVIIIAKIDVDLDVKFFLKEVFLRELITFIVSFLIVSFVVGQFESSFLRLLLTLFLTVVVVSGMVFVVGLDKSERTYAISVVKSKIKFK